MNTLFAVAAGGALGASARYLTGAAALRLIGPGFPWGTLTVNILGSFLMGLLIALFAFKLNVSGEVKSFLTTGVLGGFTTFSAFSLDAALMWERGEAGTAAIYVVASVVLAIGALFAGLWLVRSFV